MYGIVITLISKFDYVTTPHAIMAYANILNWATLLLLHTQQVQAKMEKEAREKEEDSRYRRQVARFVAEKGQEELQVLKAKQEQKRARGFRVHEEGISHFFSGSVGS